MKGNCYYSGEKWNGDQSNKAFRAAFDKLAQEQQKTYLDWRKQPGNGTFRVLGKHLGSFIGTGCTLNIDVRE